LLISVLSNN